ncbi:MAG: immune inhibitor A [Nocardioides sp.]|uniref:PKD domain-containing protein n=1 Tax=Nocardioides sp. TaxID=35761 RepID=UPI0039E63317
MSRTTIRRARLLAIAATITALALSPALGTAVATAATSGAGSASIPTATPAAGSTGAMLFYILPVRQPLPCVGVGLNATSDPSIDRDSCAFFSFTPTNVSGTMTAELFHEGATTAFATLPVAVDATDGSASVDLEPDDTWIPGQVRMVVLEGTDPIGESTFLYNTLQGTVSAGAATAPGEAFTVTGTLSTHRAGGGAVPATTTGVPATFEIAVTAPDSATPLWTSSQQTAGSDGSYSVTVPASVTAGLAAPTGSYTTGLSVAIVDASYTDSSTGVWAGPASLATSHTIDFPATTLTIENSFVSSVGWVKPGDEYPSRIVLSNPTAAPITPTISVSVPTGSTLLTASGPGSHPVSGSSVTWAPGAIAAQGSAVLVLTAKAATTSQLDTVVWRDLSSTAVLHVGGQSDVTAVSHGPKVIPPDETYDTARYGDRPFPIIPVQYTDRSYEDGHTGESLAEKINSPSVAGSTYNLYQEMSLGQLFPHGTVPSADIASAGFTGDGQGYDFTSPALTDLNTCAGGVTYASSPTDLTGSALYPERITNGVYDLPGNTAYYGSDSNGSAIVGAETGVGALQDIDSGCGPTGKLVADSVTIADPEIDYSDYDTDKDGVVDFFMVVFAGCGGNGASQLGACTDSTQDALPYDNIWPHSSSLAGAYTDPTTGLPGFVTHDQLKDLEGRPLWWTDTTYTAKTTTDLGDALKVYVRVGPYNVNPETAIDKASVISHEYGHSLGLPDFYTTGSRETYGDWTLMATDKSQNIDAYGRQELGWVVPQEIPDGTSTVHGWTESKHDTGTITWQRPDGTSYTLTDGTDGTVHNSQMYVAKLPGRTLLDSSAFDSGDKATPSHLWWSGSGNDFGCAPTGGHNLDLAIPGLSSLPEGTSVKLEMKSRWSIEWDYDYGFVLTTKDGGATYTSHASDNGYTTDASSLTGNPNSVACQSTYSNGITGSSGSYAAGTAATDRLLGTYTDPEFVSDSFDISDLAGAQHGALRLSYATDPGFAGPGWFIDDLKVVATVDGVEKTLWSSDFETSGGPDDTTVYNGGCRDDLRVASSCTKGWKYLEAGAASEQDHAYYLEMRDRSGFDYDSHGENDRDAIGFGAGLYLAYTDEAHGYGNVGTDDPPAQSPLDSTPEAGSETPDLNDAAFTADSGRSIFSDASSDPWIDNYTDPSSASGNWEFGYDCLSFTVDSMSGTDAAPAGNLTGDVTFTRGAGCGSLDYGYAEETPEANTAPTAVASATPTSTTTGTAVSFSAAGSTDAETPDDLDYFWSFGDGTGKVEGADPTHAYTEAGTYTAVLTVVDPEGLSDSATVTITVTAGPGTGSPGGGSTGTTTNTTTNTTTVQTRTLRDINCKKGRAVGFASKGRWRKVKEPTAHLRHYCLGHGVLRHTVSGSRFDLTYGTFTRGGTAVVFIDGRKVGTISFKGATRRPVWHTASWSLPPGKHRLTLRVRKAGAFDQLITWSR